LISTALSCSQHHTLPRGAPRTIPTRRSPDLFERVPLERLHSEGAFFAPELLITMRRAGVRVRQVGVRHFPRTTHGDGQLWRKERSEEHTSELQSRGQLVCRLLLERNKGVAAD